MKHMKSAKILITAICILAGFILITPTLVLAQEEDAEARNESTELEEITVTIEARRCIDAVCSIHVAVVR